ncbi:odorant receptor 4-like [Venturia canescens]|uniref:odorant receptor 4-like n=1 Tax=Venturia canescens TaxID=32260 RepID=UPI001C9CBDFF|nr:odorant receptor 4-like [Venturia canescens]
MTPNKGFAYAYGWNIYYEKMLGICSKRNESWWASQRAWYWALLMIICIWFPQTASLRFLWGNLNSIIDCLSTNMSIAMSIVKILVLQSQRKVIGAVLTEISGDWIPLRSKEENEIMFETARIGRRISIMSVTLTNLMFFEYILSKVWSTIIIGANDFEADPRLARGFLFDSYFPFATTDLAIYLPIWLGQFFGTLLSMASYSGPDCIVSMMVLHLCGQLRILRCSLRHVVNGTTIKEPHLFWKNFKVIVDRHEQLNRLSLLIRDTFSSILLVQMLVCSLTFCFQGYAMVTTLVDRDGTPIRVHNLAFNLLYAGFTVIHLFVYCYVGDRLFVESTNIPDDFYESPWYHLPAQEAKAFLFVCHRSKIPLKLTAGKFCAFNLRLFNSIMKNSMGYLSMLMAMRERL